MRNEFNTSLGKPEEDFFPVLLYWENVLKIRITKLNDKYYSKQNVYQSFSNIDSRNGFQ